MFYMLRDIYIYILLRDNELNFEALVFERKYLSIISYHPLFFKRRYSASVMGDTQWWMSLTSGDNGSNFKVVALYITIPYDEVFEAFCVLSNFKA